MISTVFIGNDAIKVMYGQAASGKISVRTCVSAPLTEGNILNGVLLNSGVIQTKLDELFKENNIPRKNVHLVIDGTSLNTKILKLPLMAPKKMMGTIQAEYVDINLADTVLDYSVITPKNAEGSASFLSAVAQRDFIQSYVSMFREAKIELEHIDIAVNSVMKLGRRIKSLANKTYSIMSLDGNMLVQNLFVKGEFRMVKRNRILAEPGTDEFDTEIGRNIMTMVQFNRSERTGEDISNVYLCGFPPEVVAKFGQYSEALGMSVSSFPEIAGEIVMPQGVDPTYWLYNLGSMYFAAKASNKAKDINFYTQFADPSKKKNKKETIIVAAAGGVIIALAGVYGFLMLNSLALSNKRDDLEAKVNDKNLLDRIALSEKMADDTVKYNTVIEVYKSNDLDIASNNKVRDNVTQRVLDTLLGCELGTTTVQSFSYADGTVTLNVSAGSEEEAADYITNLKATGVFDWVEYVGYSKTDTEYSYTAVAYFEGEEETTEGSVQ